LRDVEEDRKKGEKRKRDRETEKAGEKTGRKPCERKDTACKRNDRNTLPGWKVTRNAKMDLERKK